jgi:hypothetical protein
MAGNVSAIAQLAGFAFRAAPLFFNHVQAQRKRPVDPAPYTPSPHLWPDGGLHAAWLGHSTVLLKADGFTILIDPVLSRNCGIRVGPVTGPRTRGASLYPNQLSATPRFYYSSD